MERQAFARALRFLDYLPLAKWTSLVASIATGVLFAALLVVVALFVDLLDSQGEIPPLERLPLPVQQRFGAGLPETDEPESAASLKDRLQKSLDLAGDAWWAQSWDDEIKTLAKTEQSRRNLQWLIHLPALVEAEVGVNAAIQVREALWSAMVHDGLERAVLRPLEDFGSLGLVVRTHGAPYGKLIARFAAADPWTWRYGNHHYLQGLFIAALCLALLRFALAFAAQYSAARATLEAVTRLRRAVYHHTHRLGALAVRALGPSEAVSVSTRHLEVVHDGLFAWLTIWFREPAKFVLLFAFAMAIHFWLALAFMAFAFLVWAVGGQAAAHLRRQGRIAEHRAADQSALLQESLMMMRLVKVYLMELFNQARVERQLASYASSQLQRYRGEALYRPLFVFLGVAAASVLLFMVGTILLSGRLGVSSAVVLTAALVCLYWPLARWLDARRILRRARESAKALFDFLDRPGSVGQAVEAEFLPPLSRTLEFDNVSLAEPGTGRKLLRGVDFVIAAGQKVAIVGPDDMEKHALLYLIPRFLDPRDGEVRIDGKSIRWVTLDSLRAQTAMVVQHNLVFSDTVANNIACGDPAFNLQRVIEAAKIAHAHHFIQKLPEGYETQIGDMGVPLEPGEKFRIALARAILREPALLIIEEPLTPLDDDTKAMVDDTYARILPGRTIIFLPHRLSTIKHCDQVFLLYRGKIEAIGDHRELLANNELYRHLQYLEFNEFAGELMSVVPSGGPA